MKTVKKRENFKNKKKCERFWKAVISNRMPRKFWKNKPTNTVRGKLEESMAIFLDKYSKCLSSNLIKFDIWLLKVLYDKVHENKINIMTIYGE